MRKFLLIVLLMLVALATVAEAAVTSTTMDVAFRAPTTREDGTAFSLSEVKAYNFYYSTTNPPVIGTATKVSVPISTSWPSLASMTYKLTGLSPNTTYYVGVTCVDTGSAESALSNIASGTTKPLAPPSAPYIPSPDLGGV